MYAAAIVAGVMGGQIQAVALGYELYDRTHSEMALGYVGLARAIPILLLAIPAGQAADWFNRRSIMLLNQCVAVLGGLAMAYLSLTRGEIWLMYACLLLRGVAGTFAGPARAALLPQLVPQPAFTNAVTWNGSSVHLALVIGPALGGLIIGHSLLAAYLCDAVLQFGALLSLLTLKPKPVERSREALSLRSLVEGVRFVVRTKELLATMSLDLLAVIFGGATALLPVYARDILHGDKVDLGWLRAAPAMGSVVVAVLMVHKPPMRQAGRTLLWMVAGFGVATILFGVSENFWFSMLMLFMTGAFDQVSVVVRHTLVQTLAPDAMRGRVSGVNHLFIGASNQLGEFESGFVAEVWGPVRSVVSGGIGTLLVVLGVSWMWPQVKRIGALADVKPAAMAEVVPSAGK